MPDRPKAEFYDLTLQEITDFGNETRHFDLAYQKLPEMTFAPGQFVAVLCPQGEKMIRRAYSIASAPQETGKISLVLKRVENGVVTNWFWGLKESDPVRVHGPFGKFILPDTIDFDPIFVATGTGVAPFRSMIRHLLATGFKRQIQLIFGIRYDDKIPYHAEWLELAQKYPNFSYTPTISRPTSNWTGKTGYVQTKLEEEVSDPVCHRVYICGLNLMIQSVQEACQKLGFKPEQVEFEKYD